jgi:hypothetical protein
MAHTQETEIPYNADADLFYVWLVWGIREPGRAPDLIAIATTEQARNRYLAAGTNAGFFRVRSEKAWLDHMYGESLEIQNVNAHARSNTKG